MKKILCSLLLLSGTCLADPARQVIYTDSRQLPRDYRVYEPMRAVSPALLEQVPWEAAGPGMRRKVLFNDRITMVLLEIDQPVDGQPMQTHYHVHDQVTYILEGRGRVRLGEVEKEVGAGAAYIAPSNVRHGLKPLTQRLVLVECFTPTREDFRPPLEGARAGVGVNDIRAFVYHWFAMLDRNAPLEELLSSLTSEHLSMQFPERTLRNQGDFQDWYRGIQARFRSARHDISDVQVDQLHSGDYRVRLRVAWTPTERDGRQQPTSRYRQTWRVSVRDGFPQIVSYEVLPD